MAHFDAVAPGRIHRVIYKDLVDDTEAEIRRLLAFCGLEFEAGCLRFWESDLAVPTHSSEQVRQPVFRSGLLIAEWRVGGWAMDVQHPELPVLVEFVLNGRVIGTTLACDYREDLAVAGKGRVHCAFTFALPIRLCPGKRAALQIRRAVDGAELFISERCRPRVPDGKLSLAA